jgi:hypothetical protein
MSEDDPRAYNIVRFYRFGSVRRTHVRARVTLEEAQRHCHDPETSSSTCTSAAGRRRTRIKGPWFDGYEERR